MRAESPSSVFELGLSAVYKIAPVGLFFASQVSRQQVSR